MSTLKVSVSGIRGIVGESLTPEVIIDYTKAYSKYISKFGNNIAIACDTRPTGEIISSIVSGILMSLGFNVINFGIMPTPVLIYAVRKFNLAGGIVITASHNPLEWNALKLIKKNGYFLNENDIREVIQYSKSLEIEYKNYDSIGKNIKSGEYENFINTYIEDLLKNFDVELIKSKCFKIGYDPVNATGSFITPHLMKRLNIELFAINDEIDKGFLRGAEPLAENLESLKNLVKEKTLDSGFALDPDADRLALIDNNANAIGEEYTLALAIYSAFKYKKISSDVTVNLSTSMMTKDIAEKFNKKVHEAKVGEINVLEKMLETKSMLGGEGNGGVIYPAFNNARDSFVAMMFILELLAKENKKLSEIIDLLPHYYITKDKVQISNFDREKLIKSLKALYPDLLINELDGIKISGDKFWVHVRSSNTEPVVRIIVESPERDFNQRIIEKIRENLLLDSN